MAAIPLLVLLAGEGGAVSVTFEQNSEPAGLVAHTGMLDSGVQVATTNAPGLIQGYRFSFWTRNGAGQRDTLGQAFNPVSFLLLESTIATAHYLPADEDANTNAVPDWWELRFHTNRVTDAAADTDADGFDVREEYRRDQHPNLKDEFRAGGMSLGLAPAERVITDTNLASYAVRSEPMGLMASSEGVTNRGSVLALPELQGVLTNGWRFAYWTLNGAVQTDRVGRAVGGLSLTLRSNTVAEAVFVREADDTNGNAIPDWWERQFHAGLPAEAGGDADEDGFETLEEYRRDQHPNLKDEFRAGGVSLSLAPAERVITDTNLASYAVRSEPMGLVVSQEGITNKGSVLALPCVYGVTNGLRFAYWTLNGAVQTDLVGRAVGGLSLTLRSNTVAEAVFVGEDDDTNGNAIPDWWERHHHAGLVADAATDADGDGFDVTEEYRRDQHPSVRDEIRPGGVSLSLAPAARVITDTNLAAYVVLSEPAGLLVGSETIADKGVAVSLPDVYGVTNGWRFAYWTLNGAAQTDALGRAVGGLSFTLRSNAVAEAVFVAASDDTNANGIPDWYERHFHGGVLSSATPDGDGDGFDLLEEYRRDAHPGASDEMRDGGISLAVSAQAGVSFLFFPRVGECLVDGVMAGAFALQPPGTGTVAMAGRSRPAVGDWDGDGDPDLFIGGEGGQVRVLENAGSPVVLNLVDRTTNFAAMAAFWSGLGCPAPALGDWNGDGVADLAVGGDTGAIRLAASTTNFLHPQSLLWTHTLDIGGTSALPAFVEVNGDGLQDLLVLLPDGSVNAYTNRGAGALPYAAGGVVSNLLGLPVPGATGIAGADVTGDGWVDILVSDAVGNIWQFDGDGAGGFTVKNKVFGGSFDGFADGLSLAVGDLDGDGDADVLGGYTQGGLVYLRNPAPRLLIDPPSVTLLGGAEKAFAALNATGTVAWSFLRNRSEGTLDPTSGVYVAGTAGRGLDTLEACDTNGLRGRAYINVITPDDVARAGKAIVIAGRRGADDPLWPTTDYLSQMGYGTLLYRGFSRENVQFFSPVPGRDTDGNGLADDIDGASVHATVAAAFTNWAMTGGDLFLYLVDHGGDSAGAGYFRLNASEVLTAASLDLWLDAIQDRHTNAVTVVVDCCYAGSFLDELAYAGPARRTVIAACGTNEPTYFVSGGLVSFSDAFFSGVMLGLDVARSFGFARESMLAYQGALLDDNGDGVFQEGVDGLGGAGGQVGLSFVAGRDIPQIGSVCGNQVLSGGSDATLWVAEVVAANPVERVWCLIVPPGHNPDPANPVADVPQCELTYSASAGRYQGTYSGFAQQGLYRVQYYARDIWGGVALPRQSYVTQDGFDERVILVAGGETNDPGWSAVNTLAAMAWHTCRQRWLGPASLRQLNARAGQDFDGDGTNDVAAAPTLATLGEAITNWAGTADKLTVYLIGAGSNGTLRLNGEEELDAARLDGWLDGYQAGNRPVSVILEFAGSGGFLAGLQPPAGRERIVIASSQAGQASMAANGGLVSFSQGFLSDLFGGYDVGRAFVRARNAIGAASGALRQAPQLDDNGDGLFTKADGAVARQRYLGSAFVTGAEAPAIGAVSPGQTVRCGATVDVWAAGVVSMAGVSNVWCVVTPPDYRGTGDLPATNLDWNAVTARYEAEPAILTRPGAYAFTFFAEDNAGEVCGPVQTLVYVADAYEPDDGPEQATGFDAGIPQARNLHASNDVDWVKFYAPAGGVFTIEAEQLGANSDLALALYYEQADGTLTNLEWLGSDECGAGVGETEASAVNLSADPSLAPGMYCVRVQSADPALYGAESEYELRIWIPVGGGSLLVVAFDKLNQTQPPPGAVVVVDGVTTQSFGTNTSLLLMLADGVHTVQVPTVAGYLPEEDPKAAGQVGNAASMWYGNPKVTAVTNEVTRCAVFQFVPVVRAEGVVRDGWTGEWLREATLQFTARSGAISNLTYASWPRTAYANPWMTLPDGSFPTNVWLPAVDWDLTLVKPTYSNLAVLSVLRSSTPNTATATNLGTFRLAPVDANGNALPDAWEARHFPGQSVAATNDVDGDGVDNGGEYRCGTDPTNKASVLRVLEVEAGATEGVRLTWPVAPGRSYRVMGTESLGTSLWPLTNGPWEAGPGQMIMQWTEEDGGARTSRFYRLEVTPP